MRLRALQRVLVRTRQSQHDSRAFATILVLWAMILVALILGALQAITFAQAAGGREALARVRAHWAARAGIETVIAKMTQDTISPDVSSAFTLQNDLAAVAAGDVGREASYSIRHSGPDGAGEVDGPEDAHAKLNVNLATVDDLMLLDGMDETTAASIVNWRLPEDAENPDGAQTGAYTGLRYPYKPRSAAFKSLAELELVSGVTSANVRGEDASLNGRLDPGENDGDASLPPDNADGKLDAGWSRFLTAVSEDGGWGMSGQPKLNLRTATADEVASRLKIDREQATVLTQHASSATAQLGDFITDSLSSLATTTGGRTGTLLTGQRVAVSDLTREQLKAVLDECTIGSTIEPRTGKININTVARSTLERVASLDATVADEIISARDGRSSGFVSMADLLDIPSVSPEELATMMESFCVRSNVYVAACRGRDRATGIEVEIVAVLDRSSIPVVIRDLLVR